MAVFPQKAVLLYDQNGNVLIGQMTAAESVPVVVASDQPPIDVAVVSGGGSNASVGTTGDPAPASATEIGGVDGSGDLVAVKVSATGVVSVDGSAVTQPVSAASLPLPTGAATEATLAGIKTGTDKIPASPSQEHTTAGSPHSARLSDGSAFYKATTPTDTQPISAASLPLPTGASTAAKQPALGTAGSPSADVITIQGAASMTAVVVDGSGVTQPVSGTVTANVGTTGGLALDATLTGGTQKSIARGAAKGATAAGDATTTNQSADRQALDVQIRTSAGAAVDSFGGGSQYADGDARGTATGTLAMVDDGTNIQSAAGDTSGRQRIVGAAADGAAVAGDPVLIGGQDGTNAQSLLTDTSGRPNVVGAAAVGAAVAGNPVLAGASDGTNVQVPRVFDVDTGGGTQYVHGVSLRKAASGGSVEAGTSSDPLRIDPTGTTTQPVSSAQLPAALVGGRLDENVGAWLGSTAPTVGQKTMASSVPVAIASDQTLSVSASTPTSTTAAQSNVAASVTSVTLLSANSGRRGATIYNDSTAILTISLNGAASSTNLNRKLYPQEAWDLWQTIPGWTGEIRGIWAVANGNARVTELTA